MQTDGCKPVAIEQIAAHADILIIAIPFGRVNQLRQYLGFLPFGAIIVDTGNYIPKRDSTIRPIDEGMPESEWVSQQLGFSVVKAFNNVIAQSLVINAKPPGFPSRVALPVFSDSVSSCFMIMELIGELGLTVIMQEHCQIRGVSNQGNPLTVLIRH